MNVIRNTHIILEFVVIFKLFLKILNSTKSILIIILQKLFLLLCHSFLHQQILYLTIFILYFLLLAQYLLLQGLDGIFEIFLTLRYLVYLCRFLLKHALSLRYLVLELRVLGRQALIFMIKTLDLLVINQELFLIFLFDRLHIFSNLFFEILNFLIFLILHHLYLFLIFFVLFCEILNLRIFQINILKIKVKNIRNLWQNRNKLYHLRVSDQALIPIVSQVREFFRENILLYWS